MFKITFSSDSNRFGQNVEEDSWNLQLNFGQKSYRRKMFVVESASSEKFFNNSDRFGIIFLKQFILALLCSSLISEAFHSQQ